MQKITLLLVFMVALPALIRAQIAQIFATANNDGTVEYLMHHLKKNTITYFSSVKPNGIVLEIKKQIGSQYMVSFPKSADIYKLEISSDAQTTEIQCTNPNGTVQMFYKCYTAYYQYGQGNAQETIFMTTYFPVSMKSLSTYIYYSTRFPTGVLLSDMGGDLMRRTFKVSFPNDKKVYELDESGDSVLKCKNPDGSIQIFKLIK